MTASLIPNLDGDSIMQCSNSKLLLSVHERIWEYTERQIGSEQQHIDPSPCWLPITHSSHMAQCIDQASVWCVCVHEEMHVLVFVCLCGKVVRSWSDHINDISGNNCKTLTLVNTSVDYFLNWTVNNFVYKMSENIQKIKNYIKYFA